MLPFRAPFFKESGESQEHKNNAREPYQESKF
jgi:hypothetical protein